MYPTVPVSVARLISRAERCGCSGIVLTLETTMLGWRIRDLDHAYLPFLRGKESLSHDRPRVRRALQETLRQEAPSRRPHDARYHRDPRVAAQNISSASRAPRYVASSKRNRGR